MEQINRELVMYSRSSPCPFVSLARRVLDRERVPYRELYIDQEPVLAQRVVRWTGFMSVPTLITTERGQDLPFREPAPLPKGESPRGINRGPMITEPGEEQLLDWLRQEGFLGQPMR